MPEAKSFLASVKDEIGTVFAGGYDDLLEVTTDEQKCGEVLKSLHKGVWEVVEKRLKESYLNGKKAANGKLPPEERKPNPFRK